MLSVLRTGMDMAEEAKRAAAAKAAALAKKVKEAKQKRSLDE